MIALLALVFSMAGTATAARVLIKSSSQVKNGAITSADLKNGNVSGRDLRADAVSGDKVRNGSLDADDFSGAARTALQAAETQALEAFRKSGPDNQPKAEYAKVATLANVPPGTYAISAKTVLTANSPESGFFDQGQTVAGRCELDAGGDKDETAVLLGTPGALAPNMVYTQITRSFGSSGSVILSCRVEQSTWRASDTSIIAVRVGKAPRSPVDG